MTALSMEFKNADPYKAEADVTDPAANDPTYATAPKIDLMQTVSQIAQPQQESANQPSMNAEQAKAMEQRNQLTSKPGSHGSALSAGSSSQAGAHRQKDAQEAATKLANDVQKLDKKIAGGDQPKATSNAFARAATGQIGGMALAAGVGMISPVAGAAVAAATIGYDVVKAFSGISQGASSFKTTDSKGRETSGYVSAAPTPQAASPVSTAFTQSLMNIPGQRKIGMGDIDNVEAGLQGIKKMPPLEMSPAATAIAGVFKNGADVRMSSNDPTYDKKEDLDFKAKPMPIPGVMVPQQPKAFFG